MPLPRGTSGAGGGGGATGAGGTLAGGGGGGAVVAVTGTVVVVVGRARVIGGADAMAARAETSAARRASSARPDDVPMHARPRTATTSATAPRRLWSCRTMSTDDEGLEAVRRPRREVRRDLVFPPETDHRPQSERLWT